MHAPDAIPIPAPALERTVAAHLAPAHVPPGALAGAVVIMIDALRASVTITAALARGCTRILPTLTVDDAHALAATLRAAAPPDSLPPLLGGERAGAHIPSFDLDNSPDAYTAPRVAGRTVIFTTTNGTAALLAAARAGAAEIAVGSLPNRAALLARYARDPRPLCLLCAATRSATTYEDTIAAGALAAAFLAAGRNLAPDDTALLCMQAWQTAGAGHDPARLLAAMRSGRGGRNLIRIHKDHDILTCAQVDAFDIVPIYRPAVQGRPDGARGAGEITLAPG
ncbi:2-phosphosulfolactate phosphatase family protein [soil metagenome]